MPVVSGIDGSVTFSGGYVTSVVGWEVTATSEDVDTTALGAAWRTRIGGLKDWSGTYDALLDGTILASGNHGLGTAPAAATFAVGGFSYSGTILITGVAGSVRVGDGPARVTFTFVGSDTATLD